MSRTVTVRVGSLTYRALCDPVLFRTTNLDRARRSRLTYRLSHNGKTALLTPLGVLNGLMGLSLYVIEGRRDHCSTCREIRLRADRRRHPNPLRRWWARWFS